MIHLFARSDSHIGSGWDRPFRNVLGRLQEYRLGMEIRNRPYLDTKTHDRFYEVLREFRDQSDHIMDTIDKLKPESETFGPTILTRDAWFVGPFPDRKSKRWAMAALGIDANPEAVAPPYIYNEEIYDMMPSEEEFI